MPKWVFWLVGPMLGPVTRRYIARNVGRPVRMDNAKGMRELGVTYRPLPDSMEEMFQQMIDRGRFA